MPKYQVRVEWKLTGVIEVEAESEEVADQIVFNSEDFPAENEYVDDSFQILDTIEIEEDEE